MVNGRNKYRIKDIFDLSAGGDVDKEHFSAYKTSEHRYPIYSNSLENHGLYGYTSNPKYSADSVTITGRGSVGHAEYREDEFDAIIRLLVLKPKSSNVCAQFVADYINNCVDFSLESTGVPQLTAPQIMNVELELPQYDEQKEVTTVLADVSSLIDMLGKQISKKKAIKQGTMQELLTGNRRLPGFSGEWETKKLEDYCSLITKQTGFDYSAYIKPALITRKMPNTFPMIQTINFRGRKFTFETDYYIPQSVLTVRKESSPKQRESFVNEWYRNLLKQEVAKYLPKWEKTTGLYCSSWQSKYMTTKWGTCNTNTQKIWLNLQLAKKPIESLEYVILHELAHLKVKNHGPEFVAVLDQYMPQWQERKRLLNESKLDYMDSDFKKDLNNKSGPIIESKSAF